MPISTLDDCQAQALTLSAIVAFENSGTDTKDQVINTLIQDLLDGTSWYDAFTSVVNSTFGIAIDPDVLRSYWATMQTSAPNAQIAAFLKRLESDPTLQEQFLAAATSYDALSQVAAANGVTISAADFQSYIEPWASFTSLLQGLYADKVIGSQQFETYAGYDPDDDSISGYGQDVDLDMMRGILSASGNAVRGTDFSSLGFPIGVVVLPVAGMVIGGYSGQTYSWGDVGSMFENSFEDGLDAASDAVTDFGSSVSSVFG